MNEKSQQLKYNDVMYSIYEKEDRRETVKDNFKFFGDILENNLNNQEKISWCDIGCATGDLLWYVQKRFKDYKIDFCGIDVEKDYVNIAKSRMPNINFYQGNILDSNAFSKDRKYDIVTLFGVLSFFEDFAPIIDKLISITSGGGGQIYIFTYFNQYGFKVKYEYTTFQESKKQTFFDIAHSIKDISSYLDDKNLSYKWHKFNINTEIPRRKESMPVRAWTQRMADGSLMQRDDICRVQEQFLLKIKC